MTEKNKKVIIRRSGAKVISETKVVDGKTITETRREEWSDQPKELEFNWEEFDKAMDAMGKVLDACSKAFEKKPK